MSIDKRITALEAVLHTKNETIAAHNKAVHDLIQHHKAEVEELEQLLWDARTRIHELETTSEAA